MGMASIAATKPQAVMDSKIPSTVLHLMQSAIQPHGHPAEILSIAHNPAPTR